MTPQQNFEIVITQDNSLSVISHQFKTSYHSLYGALQESKHVFIQHGLHYFIEQFKHRAISILEVGLGTGLNVCLTLQETINHQLNINYHAIEAFPLPNTIVQQLNYDTILPNIPDNTLAQIHSCNFETTVTLNQHFLFTKHLCLLQDYKTNIHFDIIYFDAFSPTQQPELWTIDIFNSIYNMLADKGIVVTYCAQGQMKRHLKEAGFKVIALPGPKGKREMTLAIKTL